MEFNGKIIAVTQVRTGVSAKGSWAAQDYVVENTESRYPSRLLFTVYGEENIKKYNIKLGEQVTVSFDTNATEHEGKWFGTNRAYRVTKN